MVRWASQPKAHTASKPGSVNSSSDTSTQDRSKVHQADLQNLMLSRSDVISQPHISCCLINRAQFSCWHHGRDSCLGWCWNSYHQHLSDLWFISSPSCFLRRSNAIPRAHDSNQIKNIALILHSTPNHRNFCSPTCWHLPTDIYCSGDGRCYWLTENPRWTWRVLTDSRVCRSSLSAFTCIYFKELYSSGRETKWPLSGRGPQCLRDY